jgi:predicted RNase H-like HicB family nuclease
MIEQDHGGSYACRPELPGYQSQGPDLDEILANIREASELYLETLPVEERTTCLSQEILTRSIKVPVE